MNFWVQLMLIVFLFQFLQFFINNQFHMKEIDKVVFVVAY